MRTYLVIALLLLASCGRGSQRTIHLASYNLMESFPVYLAQELGHFRDEGLRVSIDEFSGGSKVLESMMAGSTDVMCDNYNVILFMAAQGRQLKAFAVTTVVPTFLLAVSPTKVNRIRSVEDLKGALVGVGSFGGSQYRIPEYFLTRHGLAIDDVKPIATGVGPSAVAALEHGKVDVGILNSSAFRVLKRRPPGTRALLDPRSRDGCRELFGVDAFPTGCLMATPAWVDRHPDTARRLARAMVKTLRWIHAHSTEEVRARLGEKFRTEDGEADIVTLRDIIAGLSTDGRMPLGGPEIVYKVFASSFDKLQAAKFDLSKTYTNEFLEAQ